MVSIEVGRLFMRVIYLFISSCRVLYGERWASAHYAAETLGFYAILILPLAVRNN